MFFIGVLDKFSPILISLFKHSRKLEGVQKFISKNPSNIFVFEQTHKQPISLLSKMHYPSKIFAVYKQFPN
jgi:dihydroorotase